MKNSKQRAFLVYVMCSIAGGLGLIAIWPLHQTWGASPKCIAAAKSVHPAGNTEKAVEIPVGVEAAKSVIAPPVKGMLLYSSFDKGVDADYAAGSPQAKGCAGITRNQGGFKGEALVARAGFCGVELYTGVRYLTAGNLKREAGTIEFRCKPLEGFYLEQPEWRRIFICFFQKDYVNNERYYRWLRLDFRCKTKDSRFRVFEQDMLANVPSFSISAPARDWKPDVWHHVMYCWDNKHRALVVDGKRVPETALPGAPFPEPTAWLHVGTGPNGEDASHCLIDELIIWDYPRVSFQPVMQ